MAPLRTALAAAVVIGSAALAACLFPTDRSGDLRVEADAVPTLLERDTVRLAAHLVDAADAPVPNAEVRFESSDPSVLLVSDSGRAIAVGVGTATLTATAIQYDGVDPATQSVTVRGRLALDSIRPTTVRFGSLLTLYGIGLDTTQVFSVGIGGEDAAIYEYVADDPDRPERLGALSVFVKAPAPFRSEISVLGSQGGLVSPTQLTVQQRDVFEPNDTVPSPIAAADAGFANPALAFEARGRFDYRETVDWYTFTNTRSESRTLVVGGKGLSAGSFSVFITDSLYSYGDAFDSYTIGSNAWSIGPETYFCDGLEFYPTEELSPVTVVAFKDLGPGTYHVVVFYDAAPDPQSYGLALVDSYQSVVPADAYEENDVCTRAATLPSTAQLSIDNPHDIDWFKFTVPAGGQTANIGIASPDSAMDVDMYLLADFRPDSLPWVDYSFEYGVADTLSEVLPAGDYFLVMVDYAGVAGPYTLGATFAPAPPAGAAAVVRRRPTDLAAYEAKQRRAETIREQLPGVLRGRRERQ